MSEKNRHIQNIKNATIDEHALLLAVLANVPHDGWTRLALRQAAANLGIPAGAVALVFPDGIMDAARQTFTMAEDAISPPPAMHDYGSRNRVRDRIADGVLAWLAALQPHRDAVKRLWSGIPAQPLRRIPLINKALWRAADKIWRRSGDTSLDTSFYTKRILLIAVIKATLVVWFNDETPDQSTTRLFLDRRLADVVRMGKTISLAREWSAAEIMEFARGIFVKWTKNIKGA